MSWLSKPAVEWVLYEAPDVPPHLLATLLVVAVHTDTGGKGSYISAAAVAELTRKDERNAKRDLRALEKLGLLKRGNQRAAAHIRPDRRPVVYDLPVPPRGGAHDTPSRGGADVTPSRPRGGAQGLAGWRTGSSGVAHTSPEEVLNRTGRGAAADEAASPPRPEEDPWVADALVEELRRRNGWNRGAKWWPAP
jgi:hypothetical protein